MRELREHLAVLIAYGLLTVFLTYPVAFRLFESLPGDGGDSNFYVWNLWWIKKALTDLHVNPFWTDYIFYPEGVSLIFHTLVPYTGLLGVPLQAFVGLVPANNLFILLSFVLSGYGAYLLLRYLVGDRCSAFLGGMIFAFCPYKFAHLLGHVNLVITEWLPFYVLALLRLTDQAKEEKAGPSLRCGLFLLLVAFSDLSYLMYAFIFTALFVGYRIRTRGYRAFRERDYRKLATALGLFLIGFAPILVMAATALLRDGHIEVRRWGGATDFQADLFSFITPSPLHPLLGPLAQPIATMFRGNLAEATVFTGYLPLVLGLFAVAKLRSTERWVRFWSLALLVFFALSLGPFPRILGKGIKLIPLPYHLIMRTPILNNLRVPSRFDIMIMLSLAVLAAFSCRRLFERIGIGMSRPLIFLGMLLIIVFEYLAIPFPTFTPSVPRIYEQIAREPGVFSLLQIPLGRTSGVTKGLGEFPSSFMFFQTVHEKRLVGGHISRVPNATIQPLAARPLLRSILELQGANLPIGAIRDRPDRTHLDDLAALQVRYVIIHPPFDHSRVRDYVETKLPVTKISEDNGVVAFRIIPHAGEARRPLDADMGTPKDTPVRVPKSGRFLPRGEL